MAILEQVNYQPLDESDPDDYRPNSRLAFIVDPRRGDGVQVVDSMALIVERVAPGDKIPLHTHTIDEVILIDEGEGQVTLAAETKVVGRGSIVFIPAGTPHGTHNLSDKVLSLHAVFPSRDITIEYLERNPAPGTEGDPPQPPFAINVRELLEGDPNKAFNPIKAAERE